MSYPKSQCIEALRSINQQVEGKLSVKAYRQQMKSKHPSVRTIQNKFDTWNDAKSEASLSTTPATRDVDVSFFDDLDATSSYWLGFIVADGYVAPKQFKLKITKRDEEHLQQFRNDIESDHAIHEDNSGAGGTNVSLTIGRHDFTSNLYDIVGEGKTFSDTIPEIASEHYQHFFRGVFDGDGTCSPEGYKVLRIAGHKERLDKLANLSPFNFHVALNDKHPTEGHGYLQTRHNGQEVAEWMYPDGENTEPMLERKYPDWV
jgi:hypothetical protein